MILLVFFVSEFQPYFFLALCLVLGVKGREGCREEIVRREKKLPRVGEVELAMAGTQNRQKMLLNNENDMHTCTR